MNPSVARGSLDATSPSRVLAIPPDRVAAYAMDWRNDPRWTQGIKTVQLTKEAPGGGFGEGAEVTRTAYFLGRRIDYVLRVLTHEPPAVLEMSSVAGPFPMHVTYRFDEHPGGTLAGIRVRGDAGGFYRLAGPVMATMVRRNLRKDLRGLAREVGG